jgi:CRISPR-associated protein Csb2
MLAIRFTFPGGQYHATPWYRHVNEADVEWPPSPWRISRALIAVWHRKRAPAQRDEALLERLLAKLSSAPPHYHVPAAVHAHTRHYMPGKGDKRTLIFDAFARLAPDDPLVAVWPEVELEGEEASLLDALLTDLGYLGRAESWVDAVRLPEFRGDCNCMPSDEAVDTRTGEIGEIVRLLSPRPPEAWLAFRESQQKETAQRPDLKPKDKKQIENTLPASWLAAISLESNELRAAGWSAPPAAQSVAYRHPSGLLGPTGQAQARVLPSPPVTTFRFALYGKPLPRIEDAVRVGECLRRAVMSRAKKECGEAAIPVAISGHGPANSQGHTHAFWLAEDADGDGYIDHLLVHVPAGLSGKPREAVASLRRLWEREGQEWQVLLEGAGEAARFASASRLCQTGRIFTSVTPYLMPWYTKPRFGLPEQIRRECRARGLSEPIAIDHLPHLHIQGRDLTPLHFHRFRSKRGLTQPDPCGAFLRLTFDRPVQGPLALGFGCHFGLGQFAPSTAPT